MFLPLFLQTNYRPVSLDCNGWKIKYNMVILFEQCSILFSCNMLSS